MTHALVWTGVGTYSMRAAKSLDCCSASCLPLFRFRDLTTVDRRSAQKRRAQQALFDYAFLAVRPAVRSSNSSFSKVPGAHPGKQGVYMRSSWRASRIRWGMPANGD